MLVSVCVYVCVCMRMCVRVCVYLYTGFSKCYISFLFRQTTGSIFQWSEHNSGHVGVIALRTEN